MSIVKKLPAALIAAVGISFSVAGTALAEEPIFLVEKILGREERVDFVPRDTGRNVTLCFRTTDNKSDAVVYLKLIYVIDDGELDPSDAKIEDLEANAKEQCISRTMGDYMASVIYLGGTYQFGPSVRVRATQE